MLVKIRTIRDDVHIGRTLPRGSVAEVPADVAARLVRAGAVAYHDWPARVVARLSALKSKFSRMG